MTLKRAVAKCCSLQSFYGLEGSEFNIRTPSYYSISVSDPITIDGIRVKAKPLSS